MHVKLKRCDEAYLPDIISFPQMHPLWEFINEYIGEEIQEPKSKEKKVKILEVREVYVWILGMQP